MNFTKKILVGLTFTALQCIGMTHQVIRDDNGFKFFDGKTFHNIKSHDVDPSLHKMQINQLKSFLDQGGQIRASRLDNGDYVIRRHVPGLGGGPILAAIVCGVGMTLSGVAAVGTFAAVTVVTLNPVAGVAAGGAVGSAGAAATGYATAAAAITPTV